MEQDPKIPPFTDNPKHGGGSAPFKASEPPHDAPPLLVGLAPASLPPKPVGKSQNGQPLVIVLSLCLGLFLAEAIVSLIDDSLILSFDLHLLTPLRGMLFLLSLLLAILTYVLMGLIPLIPKRVFLPIALFHPVATLLVIPLSILFHGRMQQLTLAVSFCQVILGLGILYQLQGGFKFGWPLIAQSRLVGPRFSWRNLSVFLLANIFVLLPVSIVYLVLCLAFAVDHLTEGFLKVRPGGLTVQVRKYARDDGKTIQLFPMAHVGDSDFYQQLSQSFPPDSTTLMEGVTDESNLLTNKITYKRMATSLGLVEQQKEFAPQGEIVQADLDVEEFSPDTIEFLNLVMLIHSKGMNAETVSRLMQYSPPAHFEEQLWDDLLRKRNRRLLEKIQSRLLQSDTIVVPWGVAHMPDIAKEIQKSGFRLTETQDYVVVRFLSNRNKSKNVRKENR